MPDDKSDHDLLTEIHNTLCGINGYGGFLQEFEKHKVDDTLFRRDYYDFKRKVIAVACFAAGGGGLTAGIIKIVGG